MSHTSRQPTIVGVTRLAAIGAALLMLTVLTISRTQGAFSASTENSTSAFATGTVVITDDDLGAALFTLSDMKPGVNYVRCIELTYSGSMTPATIKSYGTATGALAPYLDVTIEMGTTGDFNDCISFTGTSTLFATDTLSNFAGNHTNFTNGMLVFTAPANPTSRTLRYLINVQDNNAAQGLSATATFQYEAQG